MYRGRLERSEWATLSPSERGATFCLVLAGREIRNDFRDCGWITSVVLGACGFADNFPGRHFWHGCHQTLRVLVLRIRQNLVRRSDFDDMAIMEDSDAIANSRYRAQIMGNIEDCHSGASV